MGDTYDPEHDQQLPVPNDHVAIQDLVMADIEMRKQIGIAKYGTALQPFNGRSALLDAYAEVLDLACYLKQMIVEDEERELAEARYANGES